MMHSESSGHDTVDLLNTSRCTAEYHKRDDDQIFHALNDADWEEQHWTGKGESYQEGKCTKPTLLGTWHSYSIGPFVSFGGPDWWLVRSRNPFSIATAMLSSFCLTAHVHGPTDASGQLIGLPPLHIHHAHFESEVEIGALYTKHLTDTISALVTAHGDQQCSNDLAPSCLGEDNFFFPKQLKGAQLFTAGVFQDIRPVASSRMSWSYHAAARISPCSQHAKTMSSIHIIQQPFSKPYDGHSGVEAYWWTPSNKEFFGFYTNQMPFSGRAILFKIHTHMAGFKSMLLSSGSPQQLGLARPPFLRLGRIGIDVVEAGYTSSDTLELYIVKAIERLQLQDSTIRLICRAYRGLYITSNGSFDRAASLECTDWHIQKDQSITSVMFTTFQIPTNGNRRSAKNLMHFHWHLQYVASDQTSHYSYSWSSNENNAVDICLSRNDLARLFLARMAHASVIDYGLLRSRTFYDHVKLDFLYLIDDFGVPMTVAALLSCILCGVLQRAERAAAFLPVLMVYAYALLVDGLSFSTKYVLRDVATARELEQREGVTSRVVLIATTGIFTVTCAVVAIRRCGQKCGSLSKIRLL